MNFHYLALCLYFGASQANFFPTVQNKADLYFPTEIVCSNFIFCIKLNRNEDIGDKLKVSLLKSRFSTHKYYSADTKILKGSSNDTLENNCLNHFQPPGNIYIVNTTVSEKYKNSQVTVALKTPGSINDFAIMAKRDTTELNDQNKYIKTNTVVSSLDSLVTQSEQNDS